jgi:hypothetical protein
MAGIQPSDITQFIGIPAGLTGIGIPLYLWLSGKIRLVTDMDKELAQQDERMAAIRVDRDAWRAAHGEEVLARKAAEQNSSALLGSANLSSQLLEALKIELQRPKAP